MSKPFYKSRNDFPCVPDCPDRKPACHGKCKRYLAVRAKKDKENEERLKKNNRDAYMYDAIQRNKRAGRIGKGKITHDM